MVFSLKSCNMLLSLVMYILFTVLLLVENNVWKPKSFLYRFNNAEAKKNQKQTYTAYTRTYSSVSESRRESWLVCPHASSYVLYLSLSERRVYRRRNAERLIRQVINPVCYRRTTTKGVQVGKSQQVRFKKEALCDKRTVNLHRARM